MSIPESSDKKYYNSFNLMPFIGPARFNMLLKHFNSLENAWKANLSEFMHCGISKEISEKIISYRKKISPEKEMEKLYEEGIQIITMADDAYPNELKEIPSAPAIIYIRGEFEKNELCIAIVGSRKYTAYGSQVASQFARELSQAGITIVSGMALGIDSIAHRECLKLNRRTIAVLGGGIDEKSIYPELNRKIAKEISANGAVISEYAIGTPPLKQHFPARNRIISGLSKGVLVIEAAKSSGALITVKFALEHNKEIFVIPQNIYSKNSEGSNNLIKLGAKLITNIDDILEELNLQYSPDAKKMKEIIPDSKEEELILRNLSQDSPIHIDMLAKNAEMNVGAVTSLLTLMEIKGMVKNVGGMKYIIAG